MKLKIALSFLLITCATYAQETKTISFKGCSPNERCFQEKFKEWFAQKTGNIEKYKGQKIEFEPLIDEKGEIEALMSVRADTRELELELNKILFDLPPINPFIDDKGKPVFNHCSYQDTIVKTKWLHSIG